MPSVPAWRSAAALRGTAAIRHPASFASEAELAFEEVRRRADASDRSHHQPHLALAPCDTANDVAATFAQTSRSAIVCRYSGGEGRSRGNVQCGGREKRLHSRLHSLGAMANERLALHSPSFNRARWRGRRRRHRPEIVTTRSLRARSGAALMCVPSVTRSTHVTATRLVTRSSGCERRSAPVAAAMLRSENPLA
jgi:hypothetical protein